MYGMVNEGIRKFIIEKLGEDKWLEIVRIAKLESEFFVPLKTYPDKVTFDLVGAICEVMHISPEEALEAYGRYWIYFAETSGYENLLSMFGSDFRSSIQNLNHMHEHMGTFMTGIIAPAFHVYEEDEHQITVDYFSKRQGLSPFVLGLFYGLLDRYGQAGHVENLGPAGEGYRFRITFV